MTAASPPLPGWLRSPILRSDAWLNSLTGELRDHGDALTVLLPDNPGYHYGNALIVAAPPTVDTLPRLVDRARVLLGDAVTHVCLIWDGGPMDDAARAAAVALDADLEDTLGMALTAPLLRGPDDVEVRAFSEDELDLVDAFNRDADPTERTAPPGSPYRTFKERLRGAWRAWITGGHATWHGARRADELVGQCGLAAFEGFGRFQAVETRPDHRRQGVCTALVSAVARGALASGLRRVLLAADPDGPALGLYRRLGFEPIERLQSLVIGGGPLRVRPEARGDAAELRSITTSGFGRPLESEIIDALRGQPGVLSLVAERSGHVLGHLLLSPVTVTGPSGEAWGAMALGPMAVRPSHQRQGIGGALVEAGLAACRERGDALCFVLGHPEYYPRFGFTPAPPLGLRCQWDVPDEVFQVAELRPGALDGRTGRVEYAAAFDAAG